MPRIKRYNNNTGQWEYCNTGTMPVKGIHYLTKEDYDQMKADIDSHFSGLIETLSVTVVGNQSTSSTDLIGATVSVVQSDDTPIALGIWEGSELTFNVNSGVEYYVSVDASEQGYNSFTSDTFTSKGGSSRSIEADVYAEKLTVNVSGLSSGFTITISGVGTQTSASGSYLIPYGQSYTVSASSVSSYITPSSVTYKANSTSRSVTIAYKLHPGTTNPSNGVYIKDTDGYYHTSDAWDGTYRADCVAVITSICRFGIALTESSSKMQIHSDDFGELENYMTEIEDESEARSNYTGKQNTFSIRNVQSSTSYAAGWCYAYTFPSGEKGFLPALGQLCTAYNNRSAVNTALKAAGGAAFTSDYYYWSSTFYRVGYNYRGCWVLRWGNDYVNDYSISESYWVRAFCSL